MIHGPCKVGGIDCPNRSLTCRKECPYWAEYREELTRIESARRAAKAQNYAYWQTRNKNKPQDKKGVPIYHAH